jgi:hypothetical protein
MSSKLYFATGFELTEGRILSLIWPTIQYQLDEFIVDDHYRSMYVWKGAIS